MMRKSMLATAVLGSALALAACSSGAEDAAETTDQEMMAETAADDAATDGSDMASATVLDANSADADQLAGVAGVSPELAQSIVDGRPYASVTDLNTMLRETLSDGDAETVLTSVFVPVDLNTGTEEEIRLIPGMTDRMVHEFEEYRPYADMSVFDREIGKYVDEAEVARFRNYITL